MPDAITSTSANQTPSPVSPREQPSPTEPAPVERSENVERDTQVRPEQRTQAAAETDEPTQRRPDPEERLGTQIDTSA